MAREPRPDFADALHHVMSRGNEKKPIVRDDQDRRKRLELYAEAVERYGWIVHTFTLMDNHDHLFIETPRPTLSRGMQFLNSSFATYFNRRHDRVGHLFGGRFKSVLIENEGHYLEISRYVHLNPCRAGLVQRPDDYPWSSYRGFANKADRLDWVTYTRVLREFGIRQPMARHEYAQFVQCGLVQEIDSPFRDLGDCRILGSPKFVERVTREHLLEAVADVETPAAQRNAPTALTTLPDIRQAVTACMQADPGKWQVGCRIRSGAREVAAFVGYRLCGFAASEVAEAIGYRDASSVLRATRRVDKRPEVSGDLHAVCEELGISIAA